MGNTPTPSPACIKTKVNPCSLFIVFTTIIKAPSRIRLFFLLVLDRRLTIWYNGFMTDLTWRKAKVKGSSPTVALLCISVVLLFFLVYGVLWRYCIPVDFVNCYYPATREILVGGNPYDVQGVFNPPWAFWVMVPLGLLPLRIAQTLHVLLAFGVVAYVCHKLGLGLASTVVVITSVSMLNTLANGQIDWLVLLGAVVPPMWGIPLLLIKPQLGIGVVVKTLWPTAVLSLAGLVYGLWPLRMMSAAGVTDVPSAFPWMIATGIFLLWAMKKKEDGLLVGPLVGPHINPSSYIGGWIVLAKANVLLAVAASVATWVAVIVMAGG